MTRLAFVDTETTGLDPDRHEIWEVGLIIREEDGSEREHLWYLAPDLGTADPVALEIGRFFERHPWYSGDPALAALHPVQVPASFAAEFMGLTRGCHLVGAVVSFDALRLDRLLRANRALGLWHYHLVDVEALVAGALGVAPPWSSRDLSAAVGVAPPGDEDRHTALGDARWARDLYDAALAYGVTEED